MTDFVTDGTSLPDGKMDARPTEGPEAQAITAANWNTVCAAIYDLRDAFLGNTYVSLAEEEASESADGGARLRLWENRLQASVNGGAWRALNECYNIMDYGATGDGVTDDTAAIRLAIADCPAGETLFIPAGKFRITDTVRISTGISVMGMGTASAIWTDCGVTKIGLVIGQPYPEGTTGANLQVYANFSVLGATNSCLHGIAFYQVDRGTIYNVHCRPGSVSHAVVIAGCLQSRFKLFVQNNTSAGYPTGSGTWTGAGVLIQDLRERTCTAASGGMTRSGSTVTVVTQQYHLFTTGMSIAVDASDANYADGNFTITKISETSFSYTQAGTTTASLSVGSFKIASGVAVMPTNTSYFDLAIEGGASSGGLAIEDQDQLGGDNVFTGCIQGLMNAGSSTTKGAGYALYIEGGIRFSLRDIHIEGTLHGSLITDTTDFDVTNCSFSPTDGAIGERLAINNCQRFRIQDCITGVLDIDSTDCTDYKVLNCSGFIKTNTYQKVNDGFIDFHSANSAIYMGGGGVAQSDPRNLVLNGNMARNETPPDYAGSQPTWTWCGKDKDGVDLSDTTARFHKNSWKIASTGTGQIPLWAVSNLSRYVGQPLTVWCDIKYLSGPDIYFGVYHASGFRLTNLIPSTESGWARLSMTTYITDTDLKLCWYPASNTSWSCYIGAVGASIGRIAPSGIDAPMPSFETGVQIASNQIIYAAAAPTTGAHLRGDICINNAPSAGGIPGWSCTASGTPGTWKAWAVIAA